jgi:hypothetical protein
MCLPVTCRATPSSATDLLSHALAAAPAPLERAQYGEQGVLDKYLMRAISNCFGLGELPPEEYSPALCDLLMDLLRNRLHCVATKAELTGVLVGADACCGCYCGCLQRQLPLLLSCGAAGSGWV